MTEVLLKDAVVRLYRSILGRGIGEQELSERVRKIQSATDETSVILDLVDELLASGEFARRYGPSTDFHTVTDADVFYAFKFLLGRLPESPDVYLNKRKNPGTNALIEEIIASEEFKRNNILKELLSVRRKPKGLNDLLRTGFSRVKKNVLVISGCQGKMIADLLQSGGGFSFVENVFLNSENYNRFISSKGQCHEKLLSWADIIFTQKRAIYNVLTEDAEMQKKARLIPLVEYIGFQPDQCYLTDRCSGKAIVGPLGEYHSTILSAAFFAGLDTESAVNAFNSDVYAKFGYDTIIAESKKQLLSQEAATGYPLHEMFKRWEATGKWMRTINHPKKQVLSDLVKFALEKEGLNYIPGSDEFVIDDLASNVDWPKYGATGINLDNSESTTLEFKLPKSFSPTANSAAFLNLKEFTDSFYRSMEGYSIDMVSCHQLGRKIDLEKFVDYLKHDFIS